MAVDGDGVVGVVHVLLDEVDGALGVAAIAGGGADELDVFVVIKIDDGGSHAFAVGIRDDLGVAVGADVGEAGGGGAEIDTDVEG